MIWNRRYIHYKMNTISTDILKTFYENNNKTFYPELSVQVSSISDYIEKIKNNAEIFEAYDNDLLIGVVAIYLNNLETKTGFITSVIIDKEYHKNGIGSELIKNAINYAKEKGFKKITLEVFSNNVLAIKLYSKNGFVKKAGNCKDNGFINMELVL